LICDGSVIRLIGCCSAEAPNSDLYECRGKLVLGLDTEIVYSERNFLLRGACLENTEAIIGVITFTGEDTKTMLNADSARRKMSHMETLTNHMITGIFAMQIFVCFIVAIGASSWNSKYGKHYEYFIQKRYTPAFEGFLAFWTIFSLTTPMIPISLIISLEVVKIAQSIWINNDEDMYCIENGQRARCLCSSLNEELGQIEYIFSDKTGT
jgi:P-type E1-E2 ATPase